MKNIVFVHPHRHNLNVGSYRLQTLRPVEHLRKEFTEHRFGVVSNLKEAEAFDPDVVVCMQINDIKEALELRSRRSGLKVIGFQSDGPVGSQEDLRSLDAIVVDSAPLLWKIPNGVKKVVHIYTPLEIDESLYVQHVHPGRKLRIVYIGAKGNLFFAEERLRQLKSLGYDISILSDHPDADIAWNVDTYGQELSKFDVGIVPYPENLQINVPNQFPGFFYKDPSRPTLLQAVGLPVVASPLPSYIMYGYTREAMLFANTLEEWKNCLDLLQNDQDYYNLSARFGYSDSWRCNSSALNSWVHLIGSFL